MSKTFIGSAVYREFKSEALVAEEMLHHVVCSREQFSIQTCLESGDGSITFCNWRQRVPDSWYRDAECLGLKVDPCASVVLHRIRMGNVTDNIQYTIADRVVVDWRISGYEVVDDNEASHVDKLATLFSEFYTVCNQSQNKDDWKLRNNRNSVCECLLAVTCLSSSMKPRYHLLSALYRT